MAMSCRGEILMPFLVVFSEGLYAVSKPCKPIVSSREMQASGLLVSDSGGSLRNVRHSVSVPTKNLPGHGE